MTTTFQQCGTTVEAISAGTNALQDACELLQIAPLKGREWYELLHQKLIPQLRDDSFLVVAVVGGTNIGKSVIFNHIAGFRASPTTPLASGTKHPVCLVPEGFAQTHNLQRFFEEFALSKWTSEEAPPGALEESDTHQLFWRTSEHLPENLLLLDTPDIDSDAEVNWVRADAIRRAADVLVAVLTQQKYNDAAVKKFFRQAANEDKAIIVVFNQCQLPEDHEYWPIWLQTFCSETGILPEWVYLSPNNRQAAEAIALPFFDANENSSENRMRHLNTDLSRLRFEEIKLRTLRGSIAQLLNGQSGIPAYLDEIRNKSGELQSAAGQLAGESVIRVKNWPAIPNSLLVDEIRNWWHAHQEGWSKQINRVYDVVGQGMMWPFRAIHRAVKRENDPPIETYRKQEWSAILETVEEVYEKLQWMGEAGNDMLQPKFAELLKGTSVAEVLEQLKAEHQQVDLDGQLTHVVNEEMSSFQQNSPEIYKFYRQLNNLSAAVRPVTSVVLFTLGWGPAGEAVAPFVASAAANAITPIVADFAGGTAAAVVGESAVAGVAGQGAGFLQARFQRLQTAVSTRRVNWLVERLNDKLLGSLPGDIQTAVAIPTSSEFQRVEELMAELKRQLTDHSFSKPPHNTDSE